MTSHTPGPWLVSKLPDPADAKRGLGLAVSNAEMPVAIVLGGGEPGNCDANARLISAAPDLLAFVERAAKADQRGDAPYWIELCDAARAVLAKARV